MTSLIIQTSFLGDMVLTTPLIAALAARGPVDVVATPAAGSLLANHPQVRRVIVYDKRRTGRGIRGFQAVAREMRRTNANAVYLAQGSLRSAALAFATGVSDRVGFATSAGRALYSRTIPYRKDLHHAARLWQLGTPDRDPSASEILPHLYPGAPEAEAVDALLARVTGHRPLLALAPGSVWATKRWPYYAELARELAGETQIVVIGSQDDQALAAAIAAAAGPDTIDATGALSLLASAELIGRCGAIVSNDSAPQHLASAMGTPTLTIFGPTVPGFGFGPLALRSMVAGNKGLDCRPCDKHGPPTCPLGHWKCMRDLAPDALAARVRLLLSPSPESQ